MYTIDTAADEPIMVIDRHIGYNDEDGYGIDGAAFARELMLLDGMGKTRIQVWINSPGGNVMEGYNIYNAILKSKTKVDTYCIGIAASIAAVIFQAGRNRIMCDYGILMYHNPFGSENTDALRAMRDSIVKMISTRSGMTETECTLMMARTTWIDATEAKSKNMCDTIEGSADYNKKRMATAAVENNAIGYYKEAKHFLNSLLTHKNQTDMPDFAKIANKLDLNEAASENAIMKEIDKIVNKATKVENDLAEARNQIGTKDAEILRLTGVVNQYKIEKETAEGNAVRVEVTAIVNKAAELGKIKNDADTKNRWIERGIKDKDGVQADLDSINVNKVANKLTDTIKGQGADTGGIQNAAAKQMGAIMAKLEAKK